MEQVASSSSRIESSNRHTSSTPASPRPGQKRLRNGVPVENNMRSGVQTPLVNGNATPRPHFLNDASIVLVGVRCAGKRSLGLIAATALGRKFITEDHHFQTVTGFSRQDYLRVHGSEEFHKQDVEVSRNMLEENRTGCVIDCGLGSLTKSVQEYLKGYCQTNPVIYVQRDMTSITKLLKLSDRSAKLLESGDLSHRRCSNYEFFNVEDTNTSIGDDEDDRLSPTYSFKLREAQADFSRFITRLSSYDKQMTVVESSISASDVPVMSRSFSHALFIPVSAYAVNKPDFARLQGGGDVAEVQVDQWQEGTPRLMSRLVGEIRRHLRVPVTISAVGICESSPITVYFAAMRHGLRLCPDYIVLDLSLERSWLAEFAAKRSCTQLIGSIRYRTALALVSASDDVIRQIEKALSLGIKLIRLSAYAVNRAASDAFDQFIRVLKHRYSGRTQFSAFLEGKFGRTSQVFNTLLTPVTHKVLITDASETANLYPQITSYEAIQALFSSFTLDALQFFVFGANVSNSLSPAMHNSAYKETGLWHKYTPMNVDTWDEIRNRAQDSDFGGASIAQPYKVKIVHELDSLSDHARAIGAINTLIPLRGEVQTDGSFVDQAMHKNRSGTVQGFHGDNSDWISIQKTLSKNLSPRNVIHGKTTALIVGAGGMARAATYALLQMGCRNVFVYNRTISNAQSLVEHFVAWTATQQYPTPAHIRVLESTEEQWPSGFLQPTIIISCVTHERLPGEEHVSDFIVPAAWLGSETGGAAVEQAYYINTPFIQQLKQLRTETGKPWVVVDGLEVLHEQATAQFEIMTGRNAPRQVMWTALQGAVNDRDGKV